MLQPLAFHIGLGRDGVCPLCARLQRIAKRLGIRVQRAYTGTALHQVVNIVGPFLPRSPEPSQIEPSVALFDLEVRIGHRVHHLQGEQNGSTNRYRKVVQ